MKKLICDQCGREITDPGDIELVLAGRIAWQNSVKAKGEEPRGIFPCQNYRICEGEMIIVDSKYDKKPGALSRLVKKLFSSKAD